MKMVNKATGEAVYYNPVRKAGKDVWVIQGIGGAGIFFPLEKRQTATAKVEKV